MRTEKREVSVWPLADILAQAAEACGDDVLEIVESKTSDYVGSRPWNVYGIHDSDGEHYAVKVTVFRCDEREESAGKDKRGKSKIRKGEARPASESKSEHGEVKSLVSNGAATPDLAAMVAKLVQDAIGGNAAKPRARK